MDRLASLNPKRRHVMSKQLDGAWLFSERLLYVDWIEERVLS
jgi:hypothetical protein